MFLLLDKVIFDIRWIDAINNQFYRAYGGYMFVIGKGKTTDNNV